MTSRLLIGPLDDNVGLIIPAGFYFRLPHSITLREEMRTSGEIEAFSRDPCDLQVGSFVHPALLEITIYFLSD